MTYPLTIAIPAGFGVCNEKLSKMDSRFQGTKGEKVISKVKENSLWLARGSSVHGPLNN
jgi:hypothetical protein